jgi:protein-glutamine gamma-glutamyltransferase
MTPAAHPLAPEARPVSPAQLAWLTGSLLMVVAPHAMRAPWWLILLTLCLYGWRGYFALNRGPLPARGLLLAVAAVAMLGVWLEYRTLFGRSSGILLLLLFSGLKLLETRTQRDGAAAVFLGYFLIITNFLYTQSIATALAMGAALFMLTVTLTGFSAPQRTLRANVRTAGVLLAYASPAALALFLLFPRVSGPLWGLPQDAYTAMTGLSESMSPGNIARLAQSDAIAFRAEFEGEPPPQRLRYWRGPVLPDFDGRRWTVGSQVLVDFAAPQRGGRLYRYDIVLEPHNRPWLFVLETAAVLPQQARFTSDGQVLAQLPVRERIRYSASSLADALPRLEAEDADLRRALRLPAGYNPRSLALAAQWRAEAASDDGVVARAMAFFRDGEFAYTLEPLLLGTHSVDDFLFNTKAGFCEHFAAAFVFLMRAAGVPARVVTGYQGGELNPVDRIITVRQSDAHAWTEVYLRERGWVHVDPTGLVAPGRVDGGLAHAVAGAQLPALLRPQLEWLRGLRYQWEAMSHSWNIWVIGYNTQRQRELMSLVGVRDADWRSLTAVLFACLGVLTAALLAWSLRRLAPPDPVQKAWAAFCAKLARCGVARAPHEGPRDFAQRAARALPRSRRAILRIAGLYIALRYGNRSSALGVTELRRRVRELRLA